MSEHIDSIRELNRAVDEVCFEIARLMRGQPSWIRRFITDNIEIQLKLINDPDKVLEGPWRAEQPVVTAPEASPDKDFLTVAAEYLEVMPEEVYKHFNNLPIELKLLAPCSYGDWYGRVHNCFVAHNIQTMDDVMNMSPEEMLKMRFFGWGSLHATRDRIIKLGLLDCWHDRMAARKNKKACRWIKEGV